MRISTIGDINMDINQALEMIENTMRFKGYALKTERAYKSWFKRYCHYCFDHPQGTSEEKIVGFLTWLAKARRVSIATQKQALNAIVFFYKHCVKQELSDISMFSRARQSARQYQSI